MLILLCQDRVALCRRPQNGLLAGLWQFPESLNKLDVPGVIEWVEGKGLKLRDIIKIVERKHIFTHVEWRMSGVYVEVDGENSAFTWLSLEQIDREAALPTAYRQFREEI